MCKCQCPRRVVGVYPPRTPVAAEGWDEEPEIAPERVCKLRCERCGETSLRDVDLPEALVTLWEEGLPLEVMFEDECCPAAPQRWPTVARGPARQLERLPGPPPEAGHAPDFRVLLVFLGAVTGALLFLAWQFS